MKRQPCLWNKESRFIAVCCDLVRPSLSKIQPVGIALSFQNTQSVPILVSRPCKRDFWWSWLVRGLRAMNHGRVSSVWESASFLKVKKTCVSKHSRHCPTKLALKCYHQSLWAFLSSHDWQESSLLQIVHSEMKGGFQQVVRVSPQGKVARGCNEWQLKALSLLNKYTL